MKPTIFISAGLLSSLLFTFNASACDDTPCETAYLAETVEHVANHSRRADTYLTERHAHAANRERRDYADYVRKFLAKFGDPTDRPESVTDTKSLTQL
jgi:hypothetical protein